ncbi:hypothetical protein M0812_29729 [Anaeramoeba flamelloides]|uniref:Uncharacterized protein n=1 Tax=Anaeramoeba flamelloides TaxID=1746091 RepID=A0AAV7Y8B5_9EUKA|nr:hypothetical protein M0812_29729 [Anaeramoeba flamelloides]
MINNNVGGGDDGNENKNSNDYKNTNENMIKISIDQLNFPKINLDKKEKEKDIEKEKENKNENVLMNYIQDKKLVKGDGHDDYNGSDVVQYNEGETNKNKNGIKITMNQLNFPKTDLDKKVKEKDIEK